MEKIYRSVTLQVTIFFLLSVTSLVLMKCLLLNCQELIDWYMAIRSAKFCLLGLNGPRADPSKVRRVLRKPSAAVAMMKSHIKNRSMELKC